MTVDNVSAWRQIKFAQNAKTMFGFLTVAVIGIAGFFVGFRIGQINVFKGGGASAAQGRIFAAPQIPHQILRFGFTAVIGTAGNAVGRVHQHTALNGMTIQNKGVETAVLIHGNAAMEQQIAIETLVHSALFVEKADVFVQACAVPEGFGKLSDHFLFAAGQGIGVGGIDRREGKIA